jgi:hypothetical protein
MRVAISALLGLLWSTYAWSGPLVQDTPKAAVERAIGDLVRGFWIGPTDTGYPVLSYQGWGSYPPTIWSMSTVIDNEYEWWKTTGSADAAARIRAEWAWIQRHYTTATITGCGSTTSGGYVYTVNTATDDCAYNAKTLLQIYDVTGDALALSDAIALQACSAARWASGTGGLTYSDSFTFKYISQSQYMLNALAIYQFNGDAAQLAIATTENTFIQTNMLRADGLYRSSVNADNTPTNVGDPNPHIPGSAVCLNGNMAMAVYAARQYAITGSGSWVTLITNTVTGMLAKETVTSLSGTTVWMDDCDAFANGTLAPAFAREAVPLLSPNLRAQVSTIFANTAASIQSNDKDPTTGTYGGDWQGPYAGSWSAVGNGSIGTREAVSAQAVLMLIASYLLNGT